MDYNQIHSVIIPIDFCHEKYEIAPDDSLTTIKTQLDRLKVVDYTWMQAVEIPILTHWSRYLSCWNCHILKHKIVTVSQFKLVSTYIWDCLIIMAESDLHILADTGFCWGWGQHYISTLPLRTTIEVGLLCSKGVPRSSAPLNSLLPPQMFMYYSYWTKLQPDVLFVILLSHVMFFLFSSFVIGVAKAIRIRGYVRW